MFSSPNILFKYLNIWCCIVIAEQYKENSYVTLGIKFPDKSLWEVSDDQESWDNWWFSSLPSAVKSDLNGFGPWAKV